MKNKIVFIPGLGADEKLFKHQLDYFKNSTVISYIPPKNKETLAEYAQRFPSIDAEYLVGFSFGGQMALELNKHQKFKSIFLISSNYDYRDLKTSFKLQAIILNFLPNLLIRFTLNNLFLPIFNFKDSIKKEDKLLLTKMIYSLDISFLKWSALACSKWKHTEKKFLRIHSLYGKHDKIISISDKSHTKEINGAHLLTFTHSKEVNTWIESIIQKH